jgi:hypothetical protein
VPKDDVIDPSKLTSFEKDKLRAKQDGNGTYQGWTENAGLQYKWPTPGKTNWLGGGVVSVLSLTAAGPMGRRREREREKRITGEGSEESETIASEGVLRSMGLCTSTMDPLDIDQDQALIV